MLDKTFQSSAGPLRYLLFVPMDYSANRRYPLVVSLRGSGSTYISATDGFEAAHPWIQDSVQAREPHSIMVPECNSGTWGGLAGAASNGVMATASRIVIEAIEDLKKMTSIAKTPTWHRQGADDGNAGRRMTKALEDRGHKVVRMVCDFTIDSPAKWRRAIEAGVPDPDGTERRGSRLWHSRSGRRPDVLAAGPARHGREQGTVPASAYAGVVSRALPE